MLSSVGRMVILVKEYDEALRFYTEKLGFETLVDIPAGERRFVHVHLPKQVGIGIWLLKAETEEDRAHVGRQTAGQPCAVIYTESFDQTYEELRARGVRFVKEPKREAGAAFAFFEDLYGNEFVLVELEKAKS